MPEKRHTKHVIMLVANDVSHDSRVQKTALAASEAGYRVTVIGRSMTDDRTVEQLGDAVVVRVPIQLKRLDAVKRGLTPASAAITYAERLRDVLEGRALTDEAHVARTKAHLDRSVGAGGSRVTTARLWLQMRAEQTVIKLQLLAVRVAETVARRFERRVDASHPEGSLEARKRRAVFLDFEEAYLEELASTEFDLIHAHDSTMIACARNAVDRASSVRQRPAFVYDAHEYVRGLTNLPTEIAFVNIALEQEHIGEADAVITVSPVLAARLQQHHRLAETPELVLNAPLASSFDDDSPLSVRAQCGLGSSEPLLVYAGVVKPLRGVHTAVTALPRLPGVHLALVVSSPEARAVKDVLNQAGRSGCRDRVHVVPYVAQDQVINYLRTADIGLYPLLRSGNTELSWPTKVFEYLHAGLPMVVSDMPSMAELVARHGWGEVFAADDHEAFAAAVQRVLDHPERYEASLRDPKARERFSWEQQARTLVEVYDRLVFGAAKTRLAHAGRRLRGAFR